MTHWHTYDAHQWREAVKQYGATAGIEAALARIEEKNPELCAFTVILAEQARARAQELDALPEAERGPLHGVPVAIKDENDVAGTVTSFGTNCNSTPKEEDSLTVHRLRKAGAIIIGKTTMPAFGTFPFTESEAYGVTRNPYNPEYTPGGSSGGSAVAVATGMVPIAIGGDGGGSIRIPSDRCGLVGLKPARGIIPTAPYEHLWFDLGTAGPLTRSVRDAALVYHIIADVPKEEVTAAMRERVKKGLRIGVNLRPSDSLTPLNSTNKQAVEKIAHILRERGHSIEFISRRYPNPSPSFIVQFFAGLCAEIDSLEHPEKLERLHRHTKKLGFWARGRALEWAKKYGENLGEKLEKQNFAQDYDILLTPTTSSRPGLAGKLAGRGFLGASLASNSSISYTMVWNVSGHPALAYPAGFGSDGLPTSVQFIASRANPGEGEELLCAVALELEEAERERHC